jgi:hypothetical protein
LVLVAAPSRLFAGWLAYWAVRYELRSVSARDEYGGGHFLLTTREAQSNWLQAIFCSASAQSQQGNF